MRTFNRRGALRRLGMAGGAVAAPALLGPLAGEATAMRITRSGKIRTEPGARERFTGDAYIDRFVEPSAGSNVAASNVRFAPGARTAWHTHPLGQTLVVIEGVGLCQRRGGPIKVIRPGDVVFFEPGEDHWHGAAPNNFMTHFAVVGADASGSTATWGEHVTDREYGRAPRVSRSATRQEQRG
ncbi:cupin domain-containing protein [Solirubrobacter phytolaccae]|uniref:Cupin domain-containing protein n=1 Tax=Solirubrobacter phytolaccae TaxID=1404360 RepID=A0A9X3N7U5_9ACTN|nr:cupin domain-containing protein [Solirubrobacter phytolaccae]MDA0181333.1 cupin domain-containing protein [Solirubrobacter phytolaccae]